MRRASRPVLRVASDRRSLVRFAQFDRRPNQRGRPLVLARAHIRQRAQTVSGDLAYPDNLRLDIGRSIVARLAPATRDSRMRTRLTRPKIRVGDRVAMRCTSHSLPLVAVAILRPTMRGYCCSAVDESNRLTP